MILGAHTLDPRPVLSPGERTALAAVVALVAAMPATVLHGIERDLLALAEAVVTSGRASGT